jgi:arsenical pump membrane protein
MTLATSIQQKEGPTPTNTGDRASNPQKLPTNAVVLMVPVLLVLADRFRVPARPLFLGVVAVANVASIAVPQGNPTNLVLIDRLHLSPLTFARHMPAPGLVASALCAWAVARSERRALSVRYRVPARERTTISRAERHAAVSLAGATLLAWAAPFAGIAPWWPFTGAVALALRLVGGSSRVVIPWRIAIQTGAMLIIASSFGLKPPAVPPGLLGLLAVAGGVAFAAALVNNLPAGVWAERC